MPPLRASRKSLSQPYLVYILMLLSHCTYSEMYCTHSKDVRWADEDLVQGGEVQRRSATRRKSADGRKAGVG